MLNKTLLGSAAVIMTVVGASAADLPSKKAAPANYVKICDAYGAGFYTIPGTDTCVKVGGYLRAEYTYTPAGNAVLPIAAPVVGSAGSATGLSTSAFAKYYFVQPTQVHANGQDTSGMLSRGVVQLDARTPTGFGTARTYMAIRGENKSGMYGNAALSGNFGASGQAASISVDRAFVQFAGFTFGRGDEQFSFMPAPNFISYAWSGFPSGINQLAYTAVIGGGVSATVALQDRTQYSSSTGPTSLYTAGLAGDPNAYTSIMAGGGTLVAATQANSGMLVSVANGPVTLPALAGNIRLDQSWGSAQIMGSLVQNSAVVTGATAYTGTGTPAATAWTPTVTVATFNNTFLTSGGNSGKAITKTGWALGAGVKINMPMIAAGDTLWLTAAYADGDLEHLQSSSTSDRAANIGHEFAGLIRTDRNLYITPTAWAVPSSGVAALTSVKAESPKGYSVGGIFTHYWTSTFRSNVIGSYLSIDPPAGVKNTDWMFGGLSKVTVTQIGHSFVWSPVKDLNLGLETAYARLNQSLASWNNNGSPTASFTAPATTGGAATASLATSTSTVAPGNINSKTSPNLWSVRMRVDRQF